MRVGVGVVAAVGVWLAASGASADDWVKAETANFVVYTDAGASEAERYAGKLERLDAALRLRHGIDNKPVRRKLPIYLVERAGDLRKAAPYMPKFVAGYYRAGEDNIYAVATEDEQRDDAVIMHEYVHHFIYQHFPYGYPAWLTEGLAEYYASFAIDRDNFLLGGVRGDQALALSGQFTRWLPLERVLKGDYRAGRGTDGAMFYAQGWALTHWFLSTPERRSQLAAYLRETAGGGDPAAALVKATGKDLTSMTEELRRYVRKFEYVKAPLRELPQPAVKVTPMSKGFSAVALLTPRLIDDNGKDAPHDPTDGPVLLNDVRRAATPHAGDRAADLLLARAEIKLGEPEKAEALLARRLAADPADVEALHVAASAKFKAAEAAPERKAALMGEVRALAARALKADKNYYPALRDYLEAREGLPGFPTANDIEAALDAVAIAPQATPLRVQAAQLLMHAKRYPEVVRMLKPVTASPHSGEELDKLREMQAEAERLAAAA